MDNFFIIKLGYNNMDIGIFTILSDRALTLWNEER